MSSGIKVLVLAVIVGIGSGLFSEFNIPPGSEPSIDRALVIMLASLSHAGPGHLRAGHCDRAGVRWAAARRGRDGWCRHRRSRNRCRCRWCRGHGRRRCGGRRRAHGTRLPAGRSVAATASSARSAFQAGSIRPAAASKAAAGVGNVAKTGAQAAGQKVAMARAR